MQVPAVLEIDHARGVVYVHSLQGVTVLRICGLPPIPVGTAQLDITLRRDGRGVVQFINATAAGHDDDGARAT